jgi:hypothetical protein
MFWIGFFMGLGVTCVALGGLALWKWVPDMERLEKKLEWYRERTRRQNLREPFNE